MSTGERTQIYPGSVMLFDTKAMSWTTVHRDQRALGDIAAHGDHVYVVAYPLGEPAFTIEKLSPEGSIPVTPLPTGTGRSRSMSAATEPCSSQPTVKESLLPGMGSLSAGNQSAASTPSSP